MKVLFALLLPHLIFCSNDKENVCSICHEKMSPESNDTLKTQCGHDFHKNCLATWKNTQNSCPLCRLENPHSMSQNDKNEKLKESAHCGDLIKLKEMIRQGADVNSRDPFQMTALMWAVNRGRIEVIEILLKSGADIEAQDYRKSTALMRATMSRNRDVVEFLLRNGAAVDAKNDLKMTPLVRAVAKGYTHIVENLLRYGADTEARDCRDWTALSYAVSKGKDYPYPRIAKLLLEKGADPRSIEPELYSEITPEVKELIESRFIAKSYLNKLLKID